MAPALCTGRGPGLRAELFFSFQFTPYQLLPQILLMSLLGTNTSPLPKVLWIPWAAGRAHSYQRNKYLIQMLA